MEVLHEALIFRVQHHLLSFGKVGVEKSSPTLLILEHILFYNVDMMIKWNLEDGSTIKIQC